MPTSELRVHLQQDTREQQDSATRSQLKHWNKSRDRG